MRALALIDAQKMVLSDLPLPEIGPSEVLLKVGAVGLCGTDFHIFEGSANYNFDDRGRLIPLAAQWQVLGHEFCGLVVEVGTAVSGLRVGDRVVVDQGLNCSSRGRHRSDWCEYCQSAASHQCLDYQELGITGEQGALAEFVSIPAVNAIRIENDLALREAVLCEPLGCVMHACQAQMAAHARYRFGGERPIKSVLICGAGPAGLLFTQYLRKVVGYSDLLLVSEPNALRRRLAEGFGATTIDPASVNIVEAIQELTHGEKVQYVIESAGVAGIFGQVPGILRKQGTFLLYGHGHHGADVGVINSVQFLEPAIVAPCGASGSIDLNCRPVITAQALELISAGIIDVSALITHEYATLDAIPNAFTDDRFRHDYVKGIAAFQDL